MLQLKESAPGRTEDLADVSARVTSLLADIHERGEAAVREFSTTFDGWNPEDFRVPEAEVLAAADALDEPLKRTLEFAVEQVRGFAEHQRTTLHDLEVETLPGLVLGHRHVPVASVGAYVPGGRYTLIASTYMNVVPARVAGVERVVVCTPPKDGRVDPAVLYAARLAGADAVYALGGVQAIGAMAYGVLPGLDAVDMVVGPGNAYVVEAKRQVFGRVGIDLLAGPTEIGVLADDTADPDLVACDLVGQLEHDPRSRGVLITTSEPLARAVVERMDHHLRAVSTEEVARAAWESGGEVVVVADEDELVTVSDEYALEHVEVHVRDPHRMIGRLRNYGSLFVGPETTVAYGDKVAGPNHVLPTLGAARFTGGQWVGKYLRTLTYQHATPDASWLLAEHCETESLAEGMVAHARTATLRRAGAVLGTTR
jgi:sulfopropanediol 3-dehydrogenase